VSIRIEAFGLRDGEGIAANTPITGNIKHATLRSALRLLLRDLDLTFVVRSDHLLITTPEEVKRWKTGETSKKPETSPAAKELTAGRRKPWE
jgi:hypothetical protein